MMPQPFLQFESVRKSYDGIKDVVQNLNLEIQAGEFLTLLGPSGSGKTTILMMLAGFEEPSHGVISLEGRAINALPPHQRGIGVVFQNYALFPHMSVGENLSFPLEMQGVGRAEREQLILESLAMVRLDGLADRKPSEISGGQQQRVALARALIFKPKLVLMDEPLGALDKQLRERMQLEIKHIHERLGVTIVYVTHDQSEALTMSNRIAVVHQGRIQQIAPPHILYNEPANAFVASFIGESNQIEATVVESDVRSCVLRLPSGRTVVAQALKHHAQGASVLLSIRPERVKLGPVKKGNNAFQAVVEEVIYCGDHSKLRLNFEGSTQFLIRVPSDDDGFQSPARGNSVSLLLDANSCRALEL